MDTTSKQSLKDNVIFFIQRFRIALFILVLVVIAGVIFAIVWEELSKSKLASSTALIEELDTSYEAIKSGKDDTEKQNLRKAFDDLSAKLDANQKGTFVQQRADFYKANLFFDAKDFAQAETTYIKSYNEYKSSYLAPVALINAAFSAEQVGNKDKANEYLKNLTDNYASSSPLVPRALFNIGRIAEEQQKWKDADAAYQKIIETFPTSNWTKLARDRIIKLKAQQQL